MIIALVALAALGAFSLFGDGVDVALRCAVDAIGSGSPSSTGCAGEAGASTNASDADATHAALDEANSAAHRAALDEASASAAPLEASASSASSEAGAPADSDARGDGAQGALRTSYALGSNDAAPATGSATNAQDDATGSSLIAPTAREPGFLTKLGRWVFGFGQRLMWIAGMPPLSPDQYDDYVQFRAGFAEGVVGWVTGTATSLFGLAKNLLMRQVRATTALFRGDVVTWATLQLGIDLIDDIPKLWDLGKGLVLGLVHQVDTFAVGEPREAGRAGGSLAMDVASFVVPGALASETARSAAVARRAGFVRAGELAADADEIVVVVRGESLGVTGLRDGAWSALEERYSVTQAARANGIRLENETGMVAMSGAHGALAVRAAKVARSPGYYDVFVHGTPDTFLLNRAFLAETGAIDTYVVEVSARDLARFIRSQPDYHPGMPVRLLACEAGEGARPLAQQLADQLHTEIIASDRVITIGPGGQLGSELGDGRMFRFRPAGPGGVAPEREFVHALPELPEAATWRWEADAAYSQDSFFWMENGRPKGRVIVRLVNTHEIPLDL